MSEIFDSEDDRIYSFLIRDIGENAGGMKKKLLLDEQSKLKEALINDHSEKKTVTLQLVSHIC